MDETVIRFIHDKHIDSVQKLFFLLYLYHHPGVQETGPEFGAHLYLGFTPQFEEMIIDLCATDLVDQVKNGYRLHDELQVKSCLQQLAEAFADPLIRQQILVKVKHGSTWLH